MLAIDATADEALTEAGRFLHGWSARKLSASLPARRALH